MNDYHILGDLITFTRILEALIDKIERFTFLEPKHQKIIIDLIKVDLIINNNKIKDRRKRKKEE